MHCEDVHGRMRGPRDSVAVLHDGQVLGRCKYRWAKRLERRLTIVVRGLLQGVVENGMKKICEKIQGDFSSHFSETRGDYRFSRGYRFSRSNNGVFDLKQNKTREL